MWSADVQSDRLVVDTATAGDSNLLLFSGDFNNRHYDDDDYSGERKTVGARSMADLARILEIASIPATVLNPVAGAATITAARAIRASKGEPNPSDEQWKLYQKQNKHWIDECKRLEKAKIGGEAKAIYIRRIIKGDLLGSKGEIPPEDEVNAFAEAALAAARTA